MTIFKAGKNDCLRFYVSPNPGLCCSRSWIISIWTRGFGQFLSVCGKVSLVGFAIGIISVICGGGRPIDLGRGVYAYDTGADIRCNNMTRPSLHVRGD